MVDSRILEARQDRAVDECFTGMGPRSCSTCVASPLHGGPCCFGDDEKFESDDPECRACRHFRDCKEAVHRKLQQVHNRYEDRYSRSREGRREPLVQIGGRRTSTTGSGSGPQIKSQSHNQVRRSPPPQNDSLSRIFMDDLLWGTAEGATRAAYEFFRDYKPGGKYRG